MYQKSQKMSNTFTKVTKSNSNNIQISTKLGPRNVVICLNKYAKNQLLSMKPFENMSPWMYRTLRKEWSKLSHIFNFPVIFTKINLQSSKSLWYIMNMSIIKNNHYLVPTHQSNSSLVSSIWPPKWTIFVTYCGQFSWHTAMVTTFTWPLFFERNNACISFILHQQTHKTLSY